MKGAGGEAAGSRSGHRFLRGDGIWYLGISALACIPYLDAICGSRIPFLLDLMHETLPAHVAVDRVLLDARGAMPVWNPWMLCGVPLLADPQAHLGYPPALLFRLFPFANALGMFFAVHSVIAGCGTAALLRRLGHGRAAAGVSALAFALGGHTFMLGGTLPPLAAHAWLPWVGWASAGLDTSSPRGAICLGLVFGWMAVAGQPQYLFHALPIVPAVLAGTCTGVPWRLVGWLVLAGLVAVGSSAAVALPVGTYLLGDCTRAFPLVGAASSLDRLDPTALLTYFAPFARTPAGPGSLGTVRESWATMHYMGLIPLMMVVVALWCRTRRRGKGSALFLIGLSMALALGSGLLVIGPMLKNLFPFNRFRHDALWLGSADLGMAWLAALGCETLGDMTKGTRRRLAGLMALTGSICCVIAIGGWMMSGRETLMTFPYTSLTSVWTPSLVQPAVLSLLGASVLAAFRGRRTVLMLAALTWVDLSATGRLMQPGCQGSWIMTETGTERHLRESLSSLDRGWGRLMIWPPSPVPGARPFAVAGGWDRRGVVRGLRAGLHPNLGLLAGWRLADGQNPLVPRGYAERWIRQFGNRIPLKPPLGFLRQMGVCRLISPGSVVPDATPEWRGRPHVLRLDGPVRPADVMPAGSGKVISWSGGEHGVWSVELALTQPGRLVIRECSVGGWKASVDWRRIKIVPEAGFLVGVPVSARTHHVEARYAPVSALLGAWISALVLAFLFTVASFRVEGHGVLIREAR